MSQVITDQLCSLLRITECRWQCFQFRLWILCVILDSINLDFLYDAHTHIQCFLIRGHGLVRLNKSLITIIIISPWWFFPLCILPHVSFPLVYPFDSKWDAWDRFRYLRNTKLQKLQIYSLCWLCKEMSRLFCLKWRWQVTWILALRCQTHLFI